MRKVNSNLKNVAKCLDNNNIGYYVIGTYSIYILGGFYWNEYDIDIWLDPNVPIEKRFSALEHLGFKETSYKSLEKKYDNTKIQIINEFENTFDTNGQDFHLTFFELENDSIIIDEVKFASFKKCVGLKLFGKREKDYRYIMSIISEMLQMDVKVKWG